MEVAMPIADEGLRHAIGKVEQTGIFKIRYEETEITLEAKDAAIRAATAAQAVVAVKVDKVQLV